MVIVIKDAIVTVKTSIELIRETAERIRNDPVQLKKLMRSALGPDKRIIDGQEKEHLLTVFRLIDPTEESNNQRFWTSVYEHAGKTYHLTEGDDWDELAEILPDDI
jgi:hypothetical protein